MAGRHIDSIDLAFATVPELRSGIYRALDATPQHEELFGEIGSYVLHIQKGASGEEPPVKKRKLEEQSTNGTQVLSSESNGSKRLLLEARDVSFTLPQRKKLHLGIVQYGSNLDDKNSTFTIQARNPATNQVEFESSTTSFAHVMRLPVPEKNQKQYNFCLLPAASQAASTEPIIWTVNHGPLKSCKIEDKELAEIASGPENVLEDALNYVFAKASILLILPSEKTFASAVRESHRKNDIAYHVKAFRGSKEGYLFFLENGIFFGFKKPLSFFPFNEIESISYTSVLQRTFNLNITIRQNAEAETQEVEYSMLDQQDFAGIDSYVKNHQLQDASLAEARRAKKLGKSNRAIEADGESADDGKTELEKAEEEMHDEEDELEEDYDPDEDEDDSGSGSESDEEQYTRGKGRNLIAEELGSEAEDVSASEDMEGDERESDIEDEAGVKGAGQPKPASVTMPSHPSKERRGGPDLDDDDQL